MTCRVRPKRDRETVGWTHDHTALLGDDDLAESLERYENCTKMWPWGDDR